jgi:hypothetical protein
MTYSNYADLKANKPLRWWHESVMDYMLTHPGAPLKEIAAHFKRSVTHMSIIMNTDMFKAGFAERRKHFNEELGHSVQRKMLSALDLALDVVTEQLDKKRAQIPFKDTSAFVNTTLERLGYGTKQHGVTVNVAPATSHVTITSQDLADARALLRRSEAAKLIEASPLSSLATKITEAPESDAA